MPLLADTPADLPVVERADGVWLVDQDGRRVLDGCSGAIVANLGHGHPDVLRALREQAGRVTFAYRTQFHNRPALDLADALSRRAPGDLDWVTLTNSGSEAVEAALRMALRWWQQRGEPGRQVIVGLTPGYHGMTLGALAVSGHAGRRAPYEPVLPAMRRGPAPYCYRCPLRRQPDTCALACVDELERVVTRTGVERVAAVIVEPVIGAAGGAIPAPPGYLRAVRRLCDRHGLLLIADEVMTGLGRTGTWFASAVEGVVPDLLVLGKGMSAGYAPVAAVLARRPIGDALLAGGNTAIFGHTYGGNPLSAAAALAVLQVLEREALPAAAVERGERLRAGLQRLADRHAVIGDVRGRGLLLAIELVADRATRQPFRAELQVTGRLVRLARHHDLLVYPAGLGDTDAVLVAPPLVITDREIDDLVDRLDRALADLTGELFPTLAGPGKDLPTGPNGGPS